MVIAFNFFIFSTDFKSPDGLTLVQVRLPPVSIATVATDAHQHGCHGSDGNCKGQKHGGALVVDHGNLRRVATVEVRLAAGEKRTAEISGALARANILSA